MTYRPRPIRLSDRGAAILSVLLLVFLLLIAITGAFVRTSTERRHALDASAQVDAFTFAQAGVDRYLAAVPTIPVSLPDSQVYTMTGGRAVVTLRLLVRNNVDTLFVLTSRGENSTNRYGPTAPVASRTTMQLLTYNDGNLMVPAAFTALSGLNKNGASGSLSGVDDCHSAPAPLPSLPGVGVPSVSVGNPSPDYSGPGSPIDGNPDDAAVSLGTPGTTGTAKNTVGLDWVGIRAQRALVPTYYLKTTAPTSGSWPTHAQLSGANWPTVFVEGNINLPSDGQGMLIVTGNLTMNGSEEWHGLVLVGGTITSNGNNSILGAVLTGLNIIAGIAVPQQAITNGNKTFQYNSCYIKNAMNLYKGWNRMGNAWTDNFPIY